MQTARFKTQYLPTIIFVATVVVVWVFTHSDVIADYQGATYAQSAHGDPADGVNRSTATCENWPGEECVTGSCAHCHDTFDPTICVNDVNGLMMFAPNNPTSQTENFCFECHCDPSSPDQKQSGMVQNKDYGATFGGGTANSTNIKDAFNYGPPNQPENGTSGSSHGLLAIQGWTKNRTIGDWITDDTNACVVCHDPHYAQKNYPVETTGQGGVKTAIRRPHARSSGTNTPWNQWGDESGGSPPELTSEDITYQPPKRADSGYEPAGSNLPNFLRFCDYTSCHSVVIGDDAHDAYFAQGRNLYAIVWTAGGDTHGLQNSSSFSDKGITKPPYGVEGTNYVLSCTDCHETHGSPNQWLLRTTVNGVDVGEFEQGKWYNFCLACHEFTESYFPHDYPDEMPCSTTSCHYHGRGDDNF
jgi:hypothetical protein